ncbi:MAG: hypothetical protein ACXVCY_17255 [Pseudobdellovibrionaceae bacterium]
MKVLKIRFGILKMSILLGFAGLLLFSFQNCAPNKVAFKENAIVPISSDQPSKDPVSAPSPQQETAQSCLLPWGKEIKSGEKQIAYQVPTADSAEKCIPQERVCDQGQLSGSFNFETCTIQPASSTGTVAVPAGVTAIKLTGNGGPGTSNTGYYTYDPGFWTYDRGVLIAGSQNSAYDQSLPVRADAVSFTDPGNTPSYQGTSAGQVVLTAKFQIINSGGLYDQYFDKYIWSIPQHWHPTSGSAGSDTTATINGTLHTFAGSPVNDTSTPAATVYTVPVTGGGGATFSYSIGAGGALSYIFIY